MLEQIARVVKETGKVIMDHRNTGSAGKWKGSQYKAAADLIAHDTLEHLLSRLDGSIPIISEENEDSLVKVRPEKYWLIDPIDGTASFAHGYPGFVTQVAFMENNKPVMAAIYAPKLDALYTASRGKGSFLNDTKITLKKGKDLTCLIDNYPSPEGIAKAVYHAFSCSKYIECGSISLKICKVTDGTADIFVKDVVVKDWDIAAPQLILEEAGGSLTDLQGNPFLYEGDYSNHGLVASSSAHNCMKIINWHKNQWKG